MKEWNAFCLSYQSILIWSCMEVMAKMDYSSYWQPDLTNSPRGPIFLWTRAEGFKLMCTVGEFDGAINICKHPKAKTSSFYGMPVNDCLQHGTWHGAWRNAMLKTPVVVVCIKFQWWESTVMSEIVSAIYTHFYVLHLSVCLHKRVQVRWTGSYS